MGTASRIHKNKTQASVVHHAQSSQAFAHKRQMDAAFLQAKKTLGNEKPSAAKKPEKKKKLTPEELKKKNPTKYVAGLTAKQLKEMSSLDRAALINSIEATGAKLRVKADSIARLMKPYRPSQKRTDRINRYAQSFSNILPQAIKDIAVKLKLKSANIYTSLKNYRPQTIRQITVSLISRIKGIMGISAPPVEVVKSHPIFGDDVYATYHESKVSVVYNSIRTLNFGELGVVAFHEMLHRRQGVDVARGSRRDGDIAMMRAENRVNYLNVYDSRFLMITPQEAEADRAESIIERRYRINC